jgi:hypothetical protein
MTIKTFQDFYQNLSHFSLHLVHLKCYLAYDLIQETVFSALQMKIFSSPSFPLFSKSVFFPHFLQKVLKYSNQRCEMVLINKVLSQTHDLSKCKPQMGVAIAPMLFSFALIWFLIMGLTFDVVLVTLFIGSFFIALKNIF